MKNENGSPVLRITFVIVYWAMRGKEGTDCYLTYVLKGRIKNKLLNYHPYRRSL